MPLSTLLNRLFLLLVLSSSFGCAFTGARPPVRADFATAERYCAAERRFGERFYVHTVSDHHLLNQELMSSASADLPGTRHITSHGCSIETVGTESTALRIIRSCAGQGTPLLDLLELGALRREPLLLEQVRFNHKLQLAALISLSSKKRTALYLPEHSKVPLYETESPVLSLEWLDADNIALLLGDRFGRGTSLIHIPLRAPATPRVLATTAAFDQHLELVGLGREGLLGLITWGASNSSASLIRVRPGKQPEIVILKRSQGKMFLAATNQTVVVGEDHTKESTLSFFDCSVMRCTLLRRERLGPLLPLLDLVGKADGVLVRTRSPSRDHLIAFSPFGARRTTIHTTEPAAMFRLKPSIGDSATVTAHELLPFCPARSHAIRLDARVTNDSEAPPCRMPGISAERRFGIARDGTRIPLTLFTPEAPIRNRTILIGYGAYGSEEDLSFDAIVKALLRRGARVGWCHMRGGGFFGERWHDSGSGYLRQRASEDFLVCAQALHSRDHTIVAFARSAGALAITNAVMRAPDLFSALVLESPFLDVTKVFDNSSDLYNPWEFHEWSNGTLPTNETLARVSPMQTPLRRLPPTLIIGAENDTVVPYPHACDFLARVRGEIANAEIYLWVEPGATHTISADPQLQARRETLEVGFMLR